MPTQPQISRLFALATRAGLSNAGVHAEILARYGLDSVKVLSPHQYEAFTHELSRWPRSQPPPDIAPPTASGRITCVGGFLMALAELSVSGFWWPAATDTYDALAAELLECFRQSRPSHPSLSVAQVKRIICTWLPSGLSVFRESASRYLAGHRDKDEKYFGGILRRVAKELAPRRAVAVPPSPPRLNCAPQERQVKERGPGGEAPFSNNGHALGTRSSHTADLYNALRR